METVISAKRNGANLSDGVHYRMRTAGRAMLRLVMIPYGRRRRFAMGRGSDHRRDPISGLQILPKIFEKNDLV